MSVGGLVTVPALDHDVHDVLVALIRRRLTGSDADTQVGGIQTSLNGLVKSKAHRSLHVGVLGVQGGVSLESLACQRSVLIRDVGEVSDGVHGAGRTGREAKIGLDLVDTLRPGKYHAQSIAKWRT